MHLQCLVRKERRMKAEEAKEGMRIYDAEHEEEGTIIYKRCGDQCGCDVELDSGLYTWIEFENIHELKRR